MSRNFIRIQWILDADNNEEVPDCNIAMHIFKNFLNDAGLTEKVAKVQPTTAKDNHTEKHILSCHFQSSSDNILYVEI